MTTDAVRTLIREVLAEELKRLAQERSKSGKNSRRRTKSSPTEEVVSIRSDADLQSLVQHILKIACDKSMRDKIAKGEHVFRLGNTPGGPSAGQKSKAASTLTRSDVVQIEEGFLTERRVETLPAGTRAVQLGQGVRFTPLARDRLRQRKITVERIK